MAVADMAYCNGGDPHLLRCAAGERAISAIVQLRGMEYRRQHPGDDAGACRAAPLWRWRAGARRPWRRRTAPPCRVRLLDDVLYQSVVRGWITRRVEENEGLSLNLGNIAPRVEDEVDYRHASALA